MNTMIRLGAMTLLGVAATGGFGAERPYTVVGTGQMKCYDNHHEIAPPKPGQPFHGQDAQCRSIQPAYKLSADGLTVHDQNTGLTWQRCPGTDGDGRPTSKDKLTLTQAQALPAQLNAARFGGFSDWRLPTIKELYSLILFSGADVRLEETDISRLRPFIDWKTFKFAYGDTSAGERIIDSQWATSTTYVANPNQMFGVNFADGRIKGYGAGMPGRPEKTFFVLCVRGNPAYGRNDFRDNGDGTVTDGATGLMWAKRDSGRGMNWEAALAWAQARNAEKHLGHNDWRLPHAKELQSIVDYTRSPDTTQSAAIDPVFDCTSLKNETGQADWPFYWTGTTHASAVGGGAAVYIAFGRAAGWPTGMPGKGGGAGKGGFGKGSPGGAPSSRAPRFADVHGAGAQRSDPKTGDPAAFPRGRGPQGDVVRILNFVRLARDAKD